ncbi:MAG TPA: signal recognition particle-docking protein FtsY [Candidatus Krumholzibacteria bacterium]|nr:signal recognition particle-docking protein FtsY [Candidatus Krumholzibacteria bacterium]
MFNLKEKLKRAREGLMAPLTKVLQRSSTLSVDDREEIEALLLSADVGVATTERVLATLRDGGGNLDARATVREQFLSVLREGSTRSSATNMANVKPRALVVVGINGVGKTTSIGKLAWYLKSSGQNVLLAACDTFRAAAADQLGIWAERVGVEMVRHHEGTDPASVAFDACSAAKSRGMDVVIVDTAGRLHTRANLMDELAKVRRVCEKALGPDAVQTYLVLDANLGQNSLVQAQEFTKRMQTDGVILTKLDSTAKGGIVLAVAETLNLPVVYIGVGEALDDFAPFDAERFVDALLG